MAHPRPHTFYRNELPSPPAIAFSSEEGMRVFQEALAAGTMKAYFALAEQFRTQDEPAFCGLASLTMVMNALAIDPGRIWKGPWRWFYEEMLDCCEPLEVIKREGIVMQQLACLARCNGAEVDDKLASASSEEEFRDTLMMCCQAPHSVFMIVDYNRKSFGQQGGGHFSPLGGFHRERDLVLILDVARFRYPPHWVPVKELWKSMLLVDSDSGTSRGFMTLRRSSLRPSILFLLSVRNARWRHVAQFFADCQERIACAFDGTACTMEDAVTKFFHGMSDEIPQSITTYITEFKVDSIPPEHEELTEKLLEEIRETPAFKAVAKALRGMESAPFLDRNHIGAELATILFLAAPEELWMCLRDKEKADFQKLRDVSHSELLSTEVQSVHKQLQSVISHAVTCGMVKKRVLSRRQE